MESIEKVWMKMRKVLYLQWDCFGEEYICASFKKAGLDVEIYPIPYGKIGLRHDEVFENDLQNKVSGKDYEFVFSFNFFPAVSLATAGPGIPYISWTYDSPFMYLYSKTISLSHNIVFCFDSATVDELRLKGVTTIHYLPMAAPVDVYDRIYSSSKKRQDYGAEISFVGSLYSEARQNQMKYLTASSPAVQEYLELLMNVQLQTYNEQVLERFLKPEIIAELQRVCPLPLEDDEMQSQEWMYANYFLARETTSRERTMLVHELAKRHQMKLFTPEPTPHIPEVTNCGPVDYCDGMPHVFKNTKINLNISLKSIYTGVPLRAFDVMGCGGFLISDYQKDYEGLFVPDEDYVYYTTPEDLYEKVDYYLEHDERRKQIAICGYQKVKEKHTYDIRVQEILSKLV